MLLVNIDIFLKKCQYLLMKPVNIPLSLLKRRIFTYSQAISDGLSQYKIEQLVGQGLLDHIDRGIYQIPSGSFSNEDIYRQATVIAGFPCAICLWSALVFYDLTDEIDIKTWLWIAQDKRIRNRLIRPVRRANPQWRTGIDVHEGYWVTSIERTLVEALAYPRYVGSFAANSALKQALRQKKTDIAKIITMAKNLNFFNRIEKILEVYFD